MKIYTKTGDKGQTGIFGGKRVSKADLRIVSYGDVDELNSTLGVCVALNKNIFLKKILHEVQNRLFIAGSDLATPLDSRIKLKRTTEAMVEHIEKWIDEIALKVDTLKNFIVPGGSLLASHLHLARTVCRRAERSVAVLKTKQSINGTVLVYLNRLSDLLFMMARYANKIEKVEEERWSGL